MSARFVPPKEWVQVIEVIEEWRSTYGPPRSRMVIAVAASDTVHQDGYIHIRGRPDFGFYSVTECWEHVSGRVQKNAAHRLYEVAVTEVTR